MPKLKDKLTDQAASRCTFQSTTSSGKPNGAGYTIWWCGKTPGFGLLVTAPRDRGDGLKPVKSWIVERRLPNGKTVRRKLGRASGSGRDAISAEFARKRSSIVGGELVQGIDKRGERRAAAKVERTTGITFTEALRQYIDDDSKRGRPRKQRTREDYLDMVWRGGADDAGRTRGPGELASVAEKRIDGFTGEGIKTLYRQLQKRGRTRAAYAMRVLRAVLRYHGVKLDKDPFGRDQAGKDRIRLPRANQRKTVIPQERLGLWWRAASAASNGDKFQFMVLTGARPGEANDIKASAVDLAGGRVTLLDTKNGSDHVILLSRQAKQIVVERVKGKKPAEALFEADPRESQKAIIEQSGVPFSPHDCRRTFASIAGALESGYVVKKMMNHADGGDVTQGYVVLDEATLRGAWQRVADFIEKKASQRPARRAEERVVPIARARAAA